MLRNTYLKKITTIALLTLAASAFADDKPQQFFRASLNLENIAAMTKAQEISHFLPINVAQIEASKTFLGEGSFVQNRPFGIAGYIEGLDLSLSFDSILEEGTAWVVPVKEGAASLEEIQKTALQIDANAITKGQVVTGSRIALNRTANYVAWSIGTAAAHVTDDLFANDYKKPNSLASATLNLALLRKAAPKLEDKFFESLPHDFRLDESFVAIATTLVRPIIDSFDTISGDITYDQNAVKFSFLVEPAPIKSNNSFPRPTFNEPQLAELHIVWPNAAMANWLPGKISALDLGTLPIPGIVDDESRAAAKDALVRAAKLLLAADALSIGVTFENRTPLVLMLNQYGSDFDADKEIREIATVVKTLAKKAKLSTPLDVSNYTSANQKITRVTILSHDEPQFYVDFAQAGRKLAVSFSVEKHDGKAAALLTAPANGKLTDFVTAFFSQVKAEESSNLRDFLKPGAFDAFKTAVGDNVNTLTAKSDPSGKAMIVEITQPLIIIKEMEKMMKQFGPPHGFHGDPAGDQMIIPNGPPMEFDDVAPAAR